VSQPDAAQMLRRLLAETREEEMDCDAFAMHLAEHLDGRLPAEQAELFAHHTSLCGECDEELQLLAKALGLPKP